MPVYTYSIWVDLEVTWRGVHAIGAYLGKGHGVQQPHCSRHLLHSAELSFLLGVGEFYYETRRGSLRIKRSRLND